MTSAFDHLTMGGVLAHRVAADGDRPFLTFADPLEPGPRRAPAHTGALRAVAGTGLAARP